MIAQVSIRVGDAGPDSSVEELFGDLAHRVHDDAVEHYGRGGRCTWNGYAGDFAHDRTRFAAYLRELGVDVATIRGHLTEWDDATRPIAIVHLRETPS